METITEKPALPLPAVSKPAAAENGLRYRIALIISLTLLGAVLLGGLAFLS